MESLEIMLSIAVLILTIFIAAWTCSQKIQTLQIEIKLLNEKLASHLEEKKDPIGFSDGNVNDAD